jgi:Lon protease-like protein
MTFSDTLQKMPVTIPIFPLEGVLLLPGGDLPLNIFEARYIEMTKAAMAGDRLIGMIQPCQTPEKLENDASKPFYKVGCVGRISSFEETSDGRFLINLRGMIRFNLLSHRLTDEGYRLAEVDFPSFAHDFKECDKLPEELKRPQLLEKMKDYLERQGLSIDWHAASHIPDQRFYTLLAMICPFTPPEKQALLEADNFKERCKMLKCLMDIACADDENKPCAERPC